MLRDTLILQKRELEKRLAELYIPRQAQLRQQGSNLIKVIMGPRRVGKSFFAIHQLSGSKKLGYVNFDDEKLAILADYDELLAAVDSVYDHPKILLLDEIQNLPGWELFANRLSRQGYNLFITGSNAHLLSRELATHLTGRHTAIVLFPFSFPEYLEATSSTKLTGNEKRQKLEEYLEQGGYPEPLVKKLDRKEYLSTLFDSIIYKDILRRYKIRNPQGIVDLSQYLLSNTAKEFSYTALSEIGHCKSVHTVQRYLGYLQEAYLFFTLNRFSYKMREQAGENKKIYCIDNGLVSAKAFQLSPDWGRRYENAVAVHLKCLETQDNFRLYYWRNAQNEEVDFVIYKNREVSQLIQVCVDMTKQRVREREVRALLKASAELKCKDLLVLTADYETVEEIEWFGIKGKVRFVPLWKWLTAG
jgi:hypothetical protein